MGKERARVKSDLNVPVGNVGKAALEVHDDGGSAEERDVGPTYDEKTEELITQQTYAALLQLLFYSILMFTLPFGAFFGTRHLLREKTDYTEFTINWLSVAASVVTVYLIIALYVYKAYNEKDLVLPNEATATDKSKPEKKKTK